MILLAAVASGFALLGGMVLIPLGGAVFWVVIGVLLFIGAQLLLFRALGLSSAADEVSEDDPPPNDADEAAGSDWRAWRG